MRGGGGGGGSVCSVVAHAVLSSHGVIKFYRRHVMLTSSGMKFLHFSGSLCAAEDCSESISQTRVFRFLSDKMSISNNK